MHNFSAHTKKVYVLFFCSLVLNRKLVINIRTHIIVTSYGIDSALAQILFHKYYYPDAMCITTTKEKVSRVLESIEPEVLIGFPELGIDCNAELIYPFGPTTDRSFTHDMALSLHIPDEQPKLMKYAFVADKLKKYDESVDVIREYYTAVGHDNFINEFKNTDTLSLTKGKTGMAKAYVSVLQSTCDSMVENESSCEDGIAVCKNVFNGGIYLEDSILQKYYNDNDPTSLVVMALWTIDADRIRITVRGRSGFGKLVCQSFGEEFRHPYDDSSIYLPLSSIANDSIHNVCRNALKDKVADALVKEKKAYYDKFDVMNAKSNIFERVDDKVAD